MFNNKTFKKIKQDHKIKKMILKLIMLMKRKIRNKLRFNKKMFKIRIKL